jgi:hypothetical protein
MQVWMMKQRLPPGMQDSEETELCAEMLGIGGDGAQGCGGGVEVGWGLHQVA